MSAYLVQSGDGTPGLVGGNLGQQDGGNAACHAHTQACTPQGEKHHNLQEESNHEQLE